MSNQHWRTFLLVCGQVLGPGNTQAWASQSWCVWTTFSNFLHYWSAGLPAESELGPEGICDGGTWGQPFNYQDIAHFAIPAEFYWERMDAQDFSNGTKPQDLAGLSIALSAAGVPHRKTDLVLEVKLY